MTEIPKIFISYSWTTPKHEDWVINLAERLVSDGIDVVIDKWNLKEGQDKFDFMETMVKSTEIQKVLIILDKKYSEKAELRTGGVGTETQIISPKIYGDVSQEKFIPIVAEKDDIGNAFVPTFLESRIYIDLSDQNNFEDNYEKLLRNLFQRPAYSKPKLGKAPSYLFDETPMTHKTSNIVRSFDNQITKSPQRLNSIIREFLSDFIEDLTGYSVNANETSDLFTFGKIIHDNIISYTPLRNDYIAFLEKLLKSELEFDIERYIKFFEKLPLFKNPLDENRSSWNNSEFDNFRFFIHEIFLYTIVVGLKNEKYKFIEEILYSSYFFQSRYDRGNEPKRFTEELYNYIEVFDHFYKESYSKNLISPMADFILARIPEGLSKDDIIDADLLSYYVASLDKLKRWFPVTYIYRTRNKFELFDRLISLRHFEKVKYLFAVNTQKELQDKLNNSKINEKNANGFGYSNSFDRITPIYDLIDIDKIGTIR
jgi:hypothetical protein